MGSEAGLPPDNTQGGEGVPTVDFKKTDAKIQRSQKNFCPYVVRKTFFFGEGPFYQVLV